MDRRNARGNGFYTGEGKGIEGNCKTSTCGYDQEGQTAPWCTHTENIVLIECSLFIRKMKDDDY